MGCGYCRQQNSDGKLCKVKIIYTFTSIKRVEFAFENKCGEAQTRESSFCLKVYICRFNSVG